MNNPQIQRWAHRASLLTAAACNSKSQHKLAISLLDEAESNLKAAQEAQVIIQSIAKSIQEQAHSAISAVVSRCLSSVFEAPYQFKILFEQKRGRTEAVLVFERDGETVDPMTASGGGVVDLAAFALRLACLMLKRPISRRLVVLDEPFKSPSPHYRERVKELIETLAEEMKIQFVIVTNIHELCCGNVIDLERPPSDTISTNHSGRPSTIRRVRRRKVGDG